MRIGVFCSGGDAPGMNPCMRAVVRSALAAGHEVVGIRRGYQGLLDEDFFLDANGRPVMSLRSVSNLSKLGGTIIRSSRSEAFRTEAGGKRLAIAGYCSGYRIPSCRRTNGKHHATPAGSAKLRTIGTCIHCSLDH